MRPAPAYAGALEQRFRLAPPRALRQGARAAVAGGARSRPLALPRRCHVAGLALSLCFSPFSISSPNPIHFYTMAAEAGRDLLPPLEGGSYSDLITQPFFYGALNNVDKTT